MQTLDKIYRVFFIQETKNGLFSEIKKNNSYKTCLINGNC